jgi:hypothetical protein
MVRTAYLDPFFDVSKLSMFHQYSPLIFFLISLGVGIGLIIYMIRLALKANQPVKNGEQTKENLAIN